MKQRTDDWGIRLVRTGMNDIVVLADILFAIEHYNLSLVEVTDAIEEHNRVCRWIVSGELNPSFKQLIGMHNG